MSDDTVTLDFNIGPDKVVDGLYYSQAVFDKAFGIFQENVKHGLAFGGLGNAKVVIDGIGFRVIDAKFKEDGSVEGAIRFMNTVLGNELKKRVAVRLEAGQKVRLAVRGGGKIGTKMGRKMVENLAIYSVFLVDENNKEIMQ